MTTDAADGEGTRRTRARGVEVCSFPSSRRAVTAGVRAGRRIVPMHGLLEVDVTEARRLGEQRRPPLSMTAVVIAAVARAVAAHPGCTPTVTGAAGSSGIRTSTSRPSSRSRPARVRSGWSTSSATPTSAMLPTSAELRGVQSDMSSTGTGWALQRLGPFAGRVPGLFPAMYATMSRSTRAHELIGTVQVTAVGMFAAGGGFAIAPPTLASVLVVVGGLSRRPRAVGEQIVVRPET